MEATVNNWIKKLKERPNDPIVHFNTAVAYTKLYNFEKAIYHYEESLKLKPDLYNALANIGSIYSLLGDYKKAIKYYKRALEFNNTDAQTKYNLATANLNNKNYNDAKKIFIEIINENPDYIPAYNNLAFIYIKQNELDKAIETYKKIIALNPQELFINFNIALSYLKLGKQQKALDYAFKELKLNYKNQEIVALYIKLYGDSINNDPIKMISHLENLIKEYSLNSTYIDAAIGLLYYQINNLEKSKFYFISALDKDPTNAAALNNLDYINIIEQKYDIAEDYLKKALLYDDKHIQAYFNLADLYDLTNRLKEAIIIFEQLLKFYPELPAIYFNLDKLHYKLNNNDQAKNYFNKYLSRTKDNDEYYNEAVELLKKLKFLGQ